MSNLNALCFVVVLALSFASAFSTSAADGVAPPVISLQLSVLRDIPYEINMMPTHYENHSSYLLSKSPFTRICEVQVSTEDTCKTPVARAYDHHDGDLSGQVHVRRTLISESAPGHTPTKCDIPVQSIDYDIRGEYLLQYDVMDAGGNDAEQTAFVMIMEDTQPPSINWAETESDMAGDIDEGFSITIEAGAGWHKYHGLMIPSAHDNYDGDVSGTFKASSPTPVITFDEGDSVLLVEAVAPLGAYQAEISVHDFAADLGLNHSNNIAAANLLVTLQDTTPPEIFCDENIDPLVHLSRSDRAAFWRDNVGSECSHHESDVHECGTPYTTPPRSALTCFDEFDSWVEVGQNPIALNVTSLLGEEVIHYNLGNHTTVLYNCIDRSGNEVSKGRSIKVQDTLAPTLTLFPPLYSTSRGDVAALIGEYTCSDLCSSPSDIHTKIELYSGGTCGGGDFICHDLDGSAGEHISETVCNNDDIPSVRRIEGGLVQGHLTNVDDGAYGLRYSCTDSSGNSAARCRTVQLNKPVEIPEPFNSVDEVYVKATAEFVCAENSGFSCDLPGAFLNTSIVNQLIQEHFGIRNPWNVISYVNIEEAEDFDQLGRWLRTSHPSQVPTVFPTRVPTDSPSSSPTRYPSAYPTPLPSASPSTSPTKAPTHVDPRSFEAPSVSSTANAILLSGFYEYHTPVIKTTLGGPLPPTPSQIEQELPPDGSWDLHTNQPAFHSPPTFRSMCDWVDIEASYITGHVWLPTNAYPLVSVQFYSGGVSYLYINGQLNTERTHGDENQPNCCGWTNQTVTLIPGQWNKIYFFGAGCAGSGKVSIGSWKFTRISQAPTNLPTKSPSNAPTLFPTSFPTDYPTHYPTRYPTKYPTAAPTKFNPVTVSMVVFSKGGMCRAKALSTSFAVWFKKFMVGHFNQAGAFSVGSSDSSVGLGISVALRNFSIFSAHVHDNERPNMMTLRANNAEDDFFRVPENFQFLQTDSISFSMRMAGLFDDSYNTRVVGPKLNWLVGTFLGIDPMQENLFASLVTETNATEGHAMHVLFSIDVPSRDHGQSLVDRILRPCGRNTNADFFGAHLCPSNETSLFQWVSDGLEPHFGEKSQLSWSITAAPRWHDVPRFCERPVISVSDELGVVVRVKETEGDEVWHDPFDASCVDFADGQIDSHISSHTLEAQGSPIPLSVEGPHTVVYECHNFLAVPAVPVYRTVVVYNSFCPICQLPSPVTFTEASFPYSIPTLDCAEAHNTTFMSQTTDGLVDTEQTGTYVYTYQIVDSLGHSNMDRECAAARSYVRTVIVEDTLRPIIALRPQADDDDNEDNKVDNVFTGESFMQEQSRVTPGLQLSGYHGQYPTLLIVLCAAIITATLTWMQTIHRRHSAPVIEESCSCNC